MCRDTQPSPNPDAAPAIWRLLLAYDGTDFQGWQVQPDKRTIQGTLTNTLSKIFGRQVLPEGAGRLPQGSGRTDTGVHAEGQVASLAISIDISPDRLTHVLNRHLPSSIRVLSAERATPSFHARAGVHSKTYRYQIFPRHVSGTPRERVCLPAQARFVWDCPWQLDLHRMQAASAAVVGRHDFTSFAATDPDRTQRQGGAGGGVLSNVRTIFTSTWSERDGLLVYEVCGSGFLQHMVRNLVGTFVEIGRGRGRPEDIAEILAARCRSAAGPTAPPMGLCLMQVKYLDAAATAVLQSRPA